MKLIAASISWTSCRVLGASDWWKSLFFSQLFDSASDLALLLAVFGCCPWFLAIKVTLCITLSIFLFSMAGLFLIAWLLFRLTVPRQLCSKLHHALNTAAPPKSQQVSSDTDLNNVGQILCQARAHFKAASASNSGFPLHESPCGTEPEITG